MPPKKENPKYIKGKYTVGTKESVAKYNTSHYDSIRVRVQKGRLERLKAIAEKQRTSVNNLYNTALLKYLYENYPEDFEYLTSPIVDKE